MTQIFNSEKQGLIFEIVSAQICDENETKKHVVYTLQVRFISGSDDLSPSVIERRYTHFLDLYNNLKKEQPVLFVDVSFPKKVLIGNFDNELITTRSTEFELLLRRISMESKLRNSKALLTFLQDIELTKAKKLLDEGEFAIANTILENTFKLLNKVYTDRSPAVLLALCRLFACTASIPDIAKAVRWGELTLHRYEGVSDTDLLELYIPILITCIKIWNKDGRNTDFLERRLTDLKRQGMNISESVNLIEKIDMLEKRILNFV